jgi:hypothetical protein
MSKRCCPECREWKRLSEHIKKGQFVWNVYMSHYDVARSDIWDVVIDVSGGQLLNFIWGPYCCKCVLIMRNRFAALNHQFAHNEYTAWWYIWWCCSLGLLRFVVCGISIFQGCSPLLMPEDALPPLNFCEKCNNTLWNTIKCIYSVAHSSDPLKGINTTYKQRERK